MDDSVNVRAGAWTFIACWKFLYFHRFWRFFFFAARKKLRLWLHRINGNFTSNLAVNHKHTSKAPPNHIHDVIRFTEREGDARRKGRERWSKANPCERKKLLRFEWHRNRRNKFRLRAHVWQDRPYAKIPWLIIGMYIFHPCGKWSCLFSFFISIPRSTRKLVALNLKLTGKKRVESFHCLLHNLRVVDFNRRKRLIAITSMFAAINQM